MAEDRMLRVPVRLDAPQLGLKPAITTTSRSYTLIAFRSVLKKTFPEASRIEAAADSTRATKTEKDQLETLPQNFNISQATLRRDTSVSGSGQ